jgi:hypothetical protein
MTIPVVFWDYPLTRARTQYHQPSRHSTIVTSIWYPFFRGVHSTLVNHPPSHHCTVSASPSGNVGYPHLSSSPWCEMNAPGGADSAEARELFTYAMKRPCFFPIRFELYYTLSRPIDGYDSKWDSGNRGMITTLVPIMVIYLLVMSG